MTSIKILTSGDKQHGMGHIVRSWVLAQELSKRKVKIDFDIPEPSIGFEYMRTRTPSVNRNFPADTIIIDLENGPSRKQLVDARQRYKNVIVIGGVGFPMKDQSAIDELVDLQIYQSIIVTNQYSAKNCVSGCEYIILGDKYRNTLPFSYTLRRDAVVCMGGGDPHSLTATVCENLVNSFNGYRPKVEAVFGAAAKVVEMPKGIRTTVAPDSLASLFATRLFAVTALGMTTYEAACMGIPTASINWSDDHELTAKALEEKGVTVNLGLWNSPDWGKLGTFVDKMHNESAWRKMSEAGRALVDGEGVVRVADKILEVVE